MDKLRCSVVNSSIREKGRKSLGKTAMANLLSPCYNNKRCALITAKCEKERMDNGTMLSDARTGTL